MDEGLGYGGTVIIRMVGSYGFSVIHARFGLVGERARGQVTG